MKNSKKVKITIFAAIIGAILGALGGTEKSFKLFRRIGIPILLLIFGILFKNYAAILFAFYIPIFYVGYGVPSISDLGSVLGRFWYKVFKKDHFLTDIAVKTTIGLLFSIILSVIGVLSNKRLTLLLTVPITLFSHVIFGGLLQGLGAIKVFNRKLLGVDLLRYFFLTLAAALQLII